jgi:G3E family GTPase
VQFNNKDIPFGNLLNLKSFSIDKALKMDKDFLDEGAHDAKKHDKRIGTFSFKMESEMTLESANGFLSKIVMEKGMNIYRMKGFLAIQGSKDKFVFHSVGMLFNCVPFTEWKEGEKKECVFVIIGKELEHDWLKE